MVMRMQLPSAQDSMVLHGLKAAVVGRRPYGFKWSGSRCRWSKTLWFYMAWEQLSSVQDSWC